MNLEKQIGELGRAFDEFKKTNDARLEEIKTKGYASSDKEEKLEKLNTSMTDMEAKIAQLTDAMNRTGTPSNEQGKSDAKLAEYKDALHKYMRKGIEVPKELTDYAAKAMSVDSDVDGGFFVSPEMSSEIQTKVFESSPIRQLASVQLISTDSFEILHDLDEADSGWVGEIQARPETGTPQIKKTIVPIHELYAQPLATQKLLDDAAVNIESWLAEKVSSKFMRDEATAFVSGDGNLKPRGILNYGAGDGFGLIQRKETAANNAIVADELIDVQSLLKEAYQGNATWLINRLMIGYIRKFKDVTSGQYLWQPGLAQGAPATLLGRPVMMASDLPSAVAANTDMIMYGDFRAGYQIVDRLGIRVLRDPYTSKPYVKFYTTKRVGGAVKDFEAIKSLKVKA